MEAGGEDVAKMRELEGLAADLLEAAPENRDAAELSKEAKARIERLTQVTPRPTLPSGPKPWLDVSGRFREGDVTGAFSLANECAAKKISQCRAQVGWISGFNESYKRLESLSGKELSDLLDLSDKITGNQGSTLQAHG